MDFFDEKHEKYVQPVDTREVIVIPQSHKLQILQLFHSTPLGGHLGVRKTYHKMRQRIYWESMLQDLKAYVKRCLPCIKRKSSKVQVYGELKPLYREIPFHTVALDVVGPFGPTDKDDIKILVMVDCFSH